MNRDYLTVITTAERANKLVKRKGGKLDKQPGPPISRGVASTVHVPTVQALEELLQAVADNPNQVICQGFFRGTEPREGVTVGDSFRLLSQAEMRKHDPDYTKGWLDIDGMKTTARLKRNMEPSSWILLDRDKAEGMPENLANYTDVEWLAAMSQLIPDLATAGWVRCGSTTARVTVDGEPMASTSCHYWVRVEDPTDAQFGDRLLMRSGLIGLMFRKQHKVGSTNWSIFDPTTFSHERLAYEGKPTVRGEGLAVGPPDITSKQGGRIDTRMTPDLTPEEDRVLYDRHRVTAQREGKIGRLDSVMDDTQLALKLAIDIPGGSCTVMDFVNSKDDHQRCQATFRESTSWNGFLGKTQAGMPFLFDNGTRIRYELCKKDRVKLELRLLKKRLRKSPASLKQEPWIYMLADLEKEAPGSYAEIRDLMKKEPGIKLTDVERKIRDINSDRYAPIELARAVLRTVGTGSLIYQQQDFWYWDEHAPGAWQRRTDATWLRKAVADTLESLGVRSFSASAVDDILRLLGPECYAPTAMDRGELMVNVANGELAQVGDTWELQPHRRSNFMTYVLPVAYDPAAECPRFVQFLEEVFQGDADQAAKIQLVQQMMGYTLLNETHEEKFILLIGGGSNGKSVLLHVLTALCGAANVSAVKASDLGNKFQRAYLEGKLANIVNEIHKGEVLPDADVKAITSGDLQTVERKFKDPHTITPFATLWFGTNHMPRTRDFTYALIRRAFILRFNRRFEGEAKDVDLKSYLVVKELPGVLNFALEGLRQIITDGWVNVPESTAAVDRWMVEADSVKRYLDECHAPAGKTELATFRMGYEVWCEGQAVTPVKGAEMRERLLREGLEIGPGTGNVWTIFGTSLQGLSAVK